jgi:hypothetical protein
MPWPAAVTTTRSPATEKISVRVIGVGSHGE